MHHPPVTQCRRTPTIRSGFTLLEMSIALVIVGLIIGGILIGRDMIEQAKLRSQISQITTYNLAVKTFQIKYNCLPGDCRHAASVGFVTRTGANGRGDGDGLIEGYAGNTSGGANLKGEQILFWRDLSDSGLISETLNTAIDGWPNVIYSQRTDLSPWLPRSKLGGYVYVWHGGTQQHPRDGVDGTTYAGYMTDGLHYFSISAPWADQEMGFFVLRSMPVLTPLQAYSIDVKLDDGLPQFGKVHTHDGTSGRWSSGDIATYQGLPYHLSGANDTDCRCPVISTSVPPISTPASATTCYDNGNVANATMQYSIGTNGGSGVNCNLTFRLE